MKIIFLFLNLFDFIFSKHFNIQLLSITIMGDMRKDYVSERFMIVSKNNKSVDCKKNPFAP